MAARDRLVCRPRLAGMTGQLLLALAALILGARLAAAEAADTKRELHLLRQQNEAMQQQVQRQQELIDSLGRAVAEMKGTAAPSTADSAATRTTLQPETHAAQTAPGAARKLAISGEAGLAFFRSGANGKYPKGAMRADEAKVFIEAPVWTDAYCFAELNLYGREDPSGVMSAGEIYLDFENVSRWWGRDGQLSLRLGRLDIPFGEEYLSRDAIDNPGIFHSLADFWGVDEGIEIYGALGGLQYVLAVQNGGHPSLNDFSSGQSVTVRLGWDPVNWLHLGASAMRTGGLDVAGDKLSELWFADGFIRSVGSARTTTFRANLLQGDAKARWREGHLALSGGALRYSDNDPLRHNARTVTFYSVEALQNLTKGLYTIARYSAIDAGKGFPLLGDGTFARSFFGRLSERLSRLSLGAGYRLSPNLVLKADYSFNRGREVGGRQRTDENIIGSEVAVRF